MLFYLLHDKADKIQGIVLEKHHRNTERDLSWGDRIDQSPSLTLHVGKEKMSLLSYKEPEIKLVSCWKKLDLVRVEI